jgi:hypothetical protein
VAFNDQERALLLSVKGVGQTVIARLEQLGYDRFDRLAVASAEQVVGEAAQMLGSSCWKNSPQARAAISGAIDMARSHQGCPSPTGDK